MKNIILYIVLGAINLLFYNIKVNDNKITFISYKTNKLEGNFKLISENINTKYKQKFLLIKYENTIIGNIKYFFNCISQLYHVNTSKVIVLDYNNYVVSNFKKKEVKVVQIWHATGAIKQFGNDIERSYKINNYDYVLAASDVWKDAYSSAFNVDRESVKALGIPKTDVLFNDGELNRYKKRMIEKYSIIKNKKVILYAPTFRGDPIKNIKYQKIDLDYISQTLGDEYIIMYKLHPWYGDKIISSGSNIINVNNENINMLFTITDFLVADYSALIFDYSILNKPLLFFVPDLAEYKKDRGMYLDYEKEMPGPICFSEDEIIDAIINNKFELEKVLKFKNKYFKFQDGKSTQRVAKFIDNLMQK